MRRLFLVAAAAVVLFTVPQTASASEEGGSGGYHGGFKIGPLGQHFPAHAPFFSFAYRPHWRWYEHRHYYEHYR